MMLILNNRMLRGIFGAKRDESDRRSEKMA
jgi:hypothetical protein